MRKRENKNYSFVLSLPDAKFKIPKKLKKIKNASMVSFLAKIVWKMPRKLLFRSVPAGRVIENSKKKAKKLKKN